MKQAGELLDEFLPLKLLSRIYGIVGERPAAVKFPAAVIFIDVSRYTALVEQMARRGREGLEGIPRLLNMSYARCAEEIWSRGGEVLYFSGDSLLAYWAGDTDIRNAVRLAARCAEAICSEGNEREESVNEVEPAVHVGVGAGLLWAAVLGGQPVWNLIAGGDAVMQAAEAHERARRWEYVLSDEAKRVLASDDKSVDPQVRCDATPDMPPRNWLMGFLPPQLREVFFTLVQGTVLAEGHPLAGVREEAQLSDRLDALTEIRPITALFARIRGLDCQNPTSLSRHQLLCSSLHEILRARGGPCGELYFADKGLMFVAAFGARGSVHRDDPSRAVDAARSIDLMVQGLGLSASIGIATGDALYGVVGSGRRRQLMVHGAPVNRAARLMTATPQGVLCDAPTERVSRTAFAFSERGTLQLAGLGDMAPVFRPVKALVAVHTHPRLIGRKSELDAMKHAFAETISGGKRLLLVLGESGIGKTALITSFTDDLRSTVSTVLVVPAERGDQRTSLLPWRRVLAAVLGLPSESEGFVILERVTARVKENSAIFGRLPLLSGVLGLQIPENDNTRHLEGAHRGDATMRLVADLVGVLSTRPSVVVLEDSQWLDSASLRLVEWVLASQNSLLLILCVRSEEIPEELKGLQRRADAARVNFSGLEKDDPARFCRVLDLGELNDLSIAELVSRTLGIAPLEHELARRISTLAGGNPLFAEEIALTLKSEGLVAVRDGLWRSIRPLDDLRYFEGVERVIRERVDRLDAIALDVLKAAAVIGRSFGLQELRMLLGRQMRDNALMPAVETLTAGHFVRVDPVSGTYAFRHDQIRDVVYGSIPGEVRQKLHDRLAEWIESKQSPVTRADIAVLAQQFEAAGNEAKAVKYADLAASEALQIGAFREAEAFLAVCLKHEPQHQEADRELHLRAVRWRRQLAEARYGRGDIHAQGVAARRALTLAGKSIPRTSIGSAVRLVSSGFRLAIQQLLPQTLVLARSDLLKAWEHELAYCLNQAATVDYFELQFVRGMGSLFEAVTHAERTGVTREMAVGAAQLACGLGIMGLERSSNYFMAKAERVALALADPAVHSHVCYLDALWRVGHAQWAIVDRRLQLSQQLSLQAGDQIRWCNAQVILFWSQFYRADWGALEQTAQALLSRAQSSGNIQQEVWALRCKALCALHTDRPRGAVELLQLITSAALGSSDLAAQVSSKGSLALALARMGRHGESIEVVEEALRLLHQTGQPTAHSTLVGISGVCEVLLRGREAGLSREYDQWLNWEQQALYELKRYSRVFPVGLAQYGLWNGVANWLNGRKSVALSTWKEALVASRRLSLRQDESTIAAEIRRRQDLV